MDEELALINYSGAAVRVHQGCARSSNASPVCVKGLRSPSSTGYREEFHSAPIIQAKETFPRTPEDCPFTLLTYFCAGRGWTPALL